MANLDEKVLKKQKKLSKIVDLLNFFYVFGRVAIKMINL